MARAILLVLDSVGIGGAPDAAEFGDGPHEASAEAADTLGHIAQACAHGHGDREGLRRGPLALPNLERLGLGLAARGATGRLPEGFDAAPELAGLCAHARETARGKDTVSGHWEMIGVPVQFEWGTFPDSEPCFPPELTEAILEETGLPGLLGNRHASGTAIIEALGEESVRTGKPICYASADSVFQIAAHEEHFGLERLYALCESVRRLIEPWNIGRVIARPFTGTSAATFTRTGNRRDYALPPPGLTLCDRLKMEGRAVIAIGKIDDILSGRGTTQVIKAKGNEATGGAVLAAMRDCPEGGLVFANFIDFDQEWGHRRDVPGYAACLEAFDALVPELMAATGTDDLLIITADHGNDPTWRGTDHTREQVPVLLFSPALSPGEAGARDTFADIGATIAAHLGIDHGEHGTPIALTWHRPA